jgi:hypothetical protein
MFPEPSPLNSYMDGNFHFTVRGALLQWREENTENQGARARTLHRAGAGDVG